MATNLFDALIVDPNPTSRGFLWQATIANPLFHRVQAFSKMTSAHEALRSGAKYDVVLLSSSFDRSEMETFIKGAKTTEGGKEAAYVSVLKASNQSSDAVAFGLIGGADGFLFEPFSADSLKQVAAIANKVRREFEAQRLKAGFSIMLTEVMKALDEFMSAKLVGQDVGVAHRNLLKATKGLQKIKEDDKNIYYDVACDIFQTAKPRPAIAYKGASKRVKSKLTKETLKKDRDSKTFERPTES